MTGTVKVYAAGFTTQVGARIYAAGFTTSPAVVSQARVYAAGFTSNGSSVIPVVAPIPAQTVDGWETASIEPTATPTPDSWVFTVLSGDVTLLGTGSTRTFVSPAVFAGTTVQVGVQASKGGVLSDQQVAQFTVKPWSSFILAAGGSSTAAITDGGTATTTPADTIDGGTATSAATPVLDGNGAPTSTWIPRRPIQPILAPGFGLGPFGTMPFGGR